MIIRPIRPVAKAFVIGIEHIEGAVKYTPRSGTLNGIPVRVWTKRRLQEDGKWIVQGKRHVRKGADETEVTAAFEWMPLSGPSTN